MDARIRLRHGDVPAELYQKLKSLIFKLYATGKEKELRDMFDNSWGSKRALSPVSAMHLEREGLLQKNGTLSLEAKIVLKSVLHVKEGQLRLSESHT